MFYSFLGLVLRKELEDRCERIGARPEGYDVSRELDWMQYTTIAHNGKGWIMRTGGDDLAAVLFKAVGIAPLPRPQTTPPPKMDGETLPPPAKRRGRPQRSATGT